MCGISEWFLPDFSASHWLSPKSNSENQTKQTKKRTNWRKYLRNKSPVIGFLLLYFVITAVLFGETYYRYTSSGANSLVGIARGSGMLYHKFIFKFKFNLCSQFTGNFFQTKHTTATQLLAHVYGLMYLL